MQPPRPDHPNRFHVHPKERYTLGSILLLGLLLSLAAAWWQQQAEYARQQALTNQQGRRFSNDLAMAFGVNIERLSGLHGLYRASTHVDMDEFNLYTQPVLQSHPEIQILAWAPRLSFAELPAHEKKMRGMGVTGYVTRLHPVADNTRPPKLRDEHFPITYLSPLAGNEIFQGQDLAAIPAVHKALLTARDSGLPTLSAPYRFEQDKPLSLMLVIPVFNVKNLSLNRELQRPNLMGFVLANYFIDDLFYLTITNINNDFFRVAITDITESQPVNIINQASDLQVASPSTQNRHKTTLDIAGRRWELSLADVREHPLATHALIVFSAGMFITLLLMIYLIRSTQRRRLIEQQNEVNTAELKALQNRSELLLNNTSEGILGLDINGYTTFINKAAQHMLGYKLEELRAQLQHTLIQHHYPDGREYPLHECPIYRSLTAGVTTTSDQEVFWRKDGSSYPVEYTSTPIRDDTFSTQGAVVVFRDISERKQNEQELIDARIHAEDASQAKSAFLATMSHEIRTPMNGMLGMAQLLAATALDSRQKEYIDILLQSGTALLNQVNDILDFSRIEADHLTLDHSPFDLFELCDNLIRLQHNSADAKKINLNWNYPTTCPHHFMGDSMRLRQILLNLVSNAIKFTHHGSVNLSVLCDQQIESLANLRLIIEDTGIGMKPDTVNKLFNPFSQADNSTTRQYGGSGLGLAISKRLAELMQAQLQVSSTPGVGSVFTLSLNLTISDNITPVIPQAHTPATRLSGHVLLAEDNQTNRRVAEAMLQNLGLTVSCAENGLLALQQFGEQHFDMILMDCQMPVMDGYQASRLLRKANNDVPILALTANVLPEDMTRCIEAGMNDCIRKPIEMNSFRQTLTRWLKVYDEESLPTVAVNTQHLDNMAGLMGEMFSELIPAWLRETEKYITQMESALKQQNFHTLMHVSHVLKASSGNVGAAEISKLATKLERLANDKNPDLCPALVDAIQLQFPIAKKALLAYQKARNTQHS